MLLFLAPVGCCWSPLAMTDPDDSAMGHVMEELWGGHGARHWWMLHILIKILNFTCVMG